MRSIEEISAQIDAQANQFSELKSLQQNPSPLSVWAQAKSVFIFLAQYMEGLLEKTERDIARATDTKMIGSQAWYTEQIRAFQFGDILKYVGGRLTYTEDNADKKIITSIGVQESETAGEVLVKVLKKNNEVLNGDEIAALKVYLNTLKIIGTKIAVRSAEADLLKINIDVELDRQRFREDGTHLDTNAPLREEVEKFLSQETFNNTLYLAKLVDALQAVAGVKDVHLKKAETKKHSDQEWTIIDRKCEAYSGRFLLDKASTFTYLFN